MTNKGEVMKKLILTVLFLLITSSVHAASYTDDANCMGSWGMEDDGNETDRSGEGETLTETGGDIPQSATKQEGTYSRDFEVGDTEYLTHADGGSTEINGLNQSISITLWARRESETGAQQWMVSKYNGAAGQRQYAVLSDTDEQVYCGICEAVGTCTWAVTANSVISDATWAHIACVYNDTDIRIYIDGSLSSNGADNPKAYVDGIVNSTAAFMIGSSSSPSGYYNGLIDDVGIFDKALSSSDVSDIYTNTLAGGAAARRIIMVN